MVNSISKPSLIDTYFLSILINEIIENTKLCEENTVAPHHCSLSHNSQHPFIIYRGFPP